MTWVYTPDDHSGRYESFWESAVRHWPRGGWKVFGGWRSPEGLIGIPFGGTKQYSGPWFWVVRL